jgi:hypothetical protein
MSVAGASQGANCAPALGDSAAAEFNKAASVGVQICAAGPSQGANWPCRPRRCETQRLLVRHSAPALGGSAAAELGNEAASVGVR